MSRFFALPVMAIVLALVGLRMMSAAPPLPAALPPQEAATPVVTPDEIWEAPKAPPPPPPPQPSAPAPKAEPLIIVLEPLPAPPPPAERPVVVAPQTTIINAPVTYIQPVVEVAPEPRVEVVEVPVAVFVGPLRAPRRPALQQDTFFKSIPFLPPTPKGPRWNP
ncbi:MAG: hypothetical protein HY293_22560 [Planctomycetes bacterium]|nr:hypothetical protein [Planctomycetota bacterium]